MSENKFSEVMKVVSVGNLCPGDIGWGTCDGCEKNTNKFPGVLIDGVTQDAAGLLFEECEVLPVGTKAKMVELEENLKQSMKNNDELRNDNYQLRQEVKELEIGNAELLDVLEKLVMFVDGSGMQFGRVTAETWNKSYDVMKNAREAIQKEKGERQWIMNLKP